MEKAEDKATLWRKEQNVVQPPKFSVIIGSKVKACNIEALNREGKGVNEIDDFYQDGTVIEIHDPYVCDVQFENGDILYNAKVNAFKQT